MLSDNDFVKTQSFGNLTPAKALKIYREKSGFTQLELAEKVGLKQSTISSMESGRTAIGVDRAKVIAKALRIQPSAIIFAGS